MALHTGVELTRTLELRGVRDRSNAGVDVAGIDRVNMGLPWSVAALTVDAFGQRQRKLGAVPVVLHSGPRVAVVTRHAVCIDDAAEILMCGTVVARAHRPETAAFGIPADGHLEEPAVGLAVEKRLRVVAGAHHVRRFHFDDIGFFAVEADFVTPLHQRAAAVEHIVVPSGRCMLQAVAGLEVGDSLRRFGLRERTGHAGQRVRARDLRMTHRAARRIGIAALRRRRRLL